MHTEASASSTPLHGAPTAELIELALRQTGALVRAEASLATAELRADASAALLSAVAMIAAVTLFGLAIALLVAALLFALGEDLIVVLVGSGGTLGVLAGVAGFVALRILPKDLLRRSRERISGEIRRIEDHAA